MKKKYSKFFITYYTHPVIYPSGAGIRQLYQFNIEIHQIHEFADPPVDIRPVDLL